MALVQSVKNGELVDTATSALSDSSKKTTGSSSLGKEAFLQLLVAQMKYQDPLEPTSNTEYVSQLATFSQLEELQNVGQSMSQSKANDLVGKPVIMKTISSTTGETYYTTGYVDAVIIEEGKPYLYINDKYFSIDDLDTVLEEEYYKKFLESQKTANGTDTTNNANTQSNTNSTNNSNTQNNTNSTGSTNNTNNTTNSTNNTNTTGSTTNGATN